MFVLLACDIFYQGKWATKKWAKMKKQVGVIMPISGPQGGMGTYDEFGTDLAAGAKAKAAPLAVCTIVISTVSIQATSNILFQQSTFAFICRNILLQMDYASEFVSLVVCRIMELFLF